jgi:hypothetical protein
MAKSLVILVCASVIAVSSAALAKGPPKPLSDWPCDTPFFGPLEAGMLWPGAEGNGEAAWADDPAARELVDFLTASENSPAMGQRKIEEFVAEHGPVKADTAARVVSGMVERGNVLRRVLLAGIKKEIIKSHVLAEAVDDDDVKLASAEKAQSQDATKLAELKEARRQNLAMLDDTADTVEHLCHRLVYDEHKLRDLAGALKAHTDAR